jgi:hypothetical protein
MFLSDVQNVRAHRVEAFIEGSLRVYLVNSQLYKCINNIRVDREHWNAAARTALSYVRSVREHMSGIECAALDYDSSDSELQASPKCIKYTKKPPIIYK